MSLLKKSLTGFVLFIALSSFEQTPQKSPLVIEGKVIMDDTGKPAPQAHVFILDGEEETLTNSNGEFRIQSWQKTPLKLTVDSYNSYRRTTIIITDPSRKQIIRLKK